MRLPQAGSAGRMDDWAHCRAVRLRLSLPWLRCSLVRLLRSEGAVMLKRLIDVVGRNRCLWAGHGWISLCRPDPAKPGSYLSHVWCPTCGAMEIQP